MSLYLFGLNHKTAPIELREKLAFSDELCKETLPLLVDGETVREAFILSTCNRVELLIESAEKDENKLRTEVFGFLNRVHQTDINNQAEHFYAFAEAEVISHLFRVASSLDSMIVGETQISGQVRRAYSLALEAGTARRVLHKLLHHAFRVAKRVRTETGVAQSAVSVSFAAVEAAQRIFGSLADKTVLLIGAGEMAELAAKNLTAKGVKEIQICNRTFQNAVKLAAEFSGAAIPFENLNQTLATADIVICSTGAADFLITKEAAENAQIARENQAQLFIDISVPRNIDPRIGELENVYLYSVDDLEAVVTTNLGERQKEASRAESIIEAEVEEFHRSLLNLDIGQTLGSLRRKMHATARRELARNRTRLGDLTPEQETAIENLLFSVVNKVSNPLLYGLRRQHENGMGSEFAEILDTLFEDFAGEGLEKIN